MASTPGRSITDAIADVYARCESLRRDAMHGQSAGDVRNALDALESASRALLSKGAAIGGSAVGELEAVQKMVQSTLDVGHRAIWDMELRDDGTKGKEKEREVLRELDEWAATRALRETRNAPESVVGDGQEGVMKSELGSRGVGDGDGGALASRDAMERSRRALAELESRFPEPRSRSVLRGREEEEEARRASRKKRDEVLLQIDATLASLASLSDSTVTIANNVGADGASTSFLVPVVDWIKSSSNFVRVGIGITIACTFIAVILIEYFVEESSQPDSLIDAGIH